VSTTYICDGIKKKNPGARVGEIVVMLSGTMLTNDRWNQYDKFTEDLFNVYGPLNVLS
jgi:hypothetical protein